jgi:tryptophanyl-tRNA synthetase
MKNKAGVSNLLTIYSAFSGKTIKELEKNYEGQGYGAFKKDLVEITVDSLRPIRERFLEIRPSQMLKDVLSDGASRANEISERTMKRVRDNLGLGSR